MSTPRWSCDKCWEQQSGDDLWCTVSITEPPIIAKKGRRRVDRKEHRHRLCRQCCEKVSLFICSNVLA